MRLKYAIVSVSDMKRAVAFYGDVLSVPPTLESLWWTEFASEGATLALHAAGTSPDDGKSRSGSAPGQCRPGFSVPNLARFHQRMIEKGVPCIQEPREVFGALVAHYLDPDGLQISVGEDELPG